MSVGVCVYVYVYCTCGVYVCNVLCGTYIFVHGVCVVYMVCVLCIWCVCVYAQVCVCELTCGGQRTTLATEPNLLLLEMVFLLFIVSHCIDNVGCPLGFQDSPVDST